MQDLETVAETRGRWIKGIGRVDVEEGEEEHPTLLTDRETNVVEQSRRLQRDRIMVQLSRGRKLSTKLIKGLSFGVLLREDTW